MSDFVERSLPSHYSAGSTLHALRIARREHPELAGLLALYEEIFALADEEGGALGDRIPLFIGRTHSLAEGIPWLHFEDLALEQHEFAEAARGIAAVLRRHRLEWADDALPADPARLLALARTAVEGRRSLIGDDSGLVEASVELAVQRAMRSLAGRVTPHLDLENWRRGECPFCGSPPVLSLLEDGNTLYAGGSFGSMGLLPNCGLAAISLLQLPAPISVPFALAQNIPNPSHVSTIIRYALPEATRVTLSVHDVQGRCVATVLDHTPQEAGQHDLWVRTVCWNAGVYFYRLQAGNRSASRKMIVLK